LPISGDDGAGPGDPGPLRDGAGRRVRRGGRGESAHVPAPRAGLGTAGLDELLEPGEVALHAAVVELEGVAHLLHDALGRPVELDGHAGLGVVQAVERHDARVVRAGRAVPRDALVGVLLGDLRVELALDAPDLRPPVRVRRVELADLLHALHEAGELLELRPLVVGGADGDVDVDRLGDGAHGATSCGCGRYAY